MCVCRMAGEEASLVDQSKLRILLLGKVGAEKTSVMKLFLKSSEEKQKRDSYSECPKAEVTLGGQTVVLVDTPGLCSPEKTNPEVMQEVRHRVFEYRGPHVFLLVLSCLDRFTAEEQDMVKIIKETFGENVTCHMMVLFTNGDELKNSGKNIQEFIDESSDLKTLVDECNGRHRVFDSSDEGPVAELLQEIRVMVQKNGGYTADMVPPAEEEGKSARLKKKISVWVTVSALVGAVVGGLACYLSGSSAGVPAAAAAGGAVGGTAGGAGILAVEHAKRRMMQ